MNISLNLLFIGFIMISFLFGCEENSDLETPRFNPKLVIYSFISPSDTAILVHVGTSTNNFGKLQDYPQKLPVKVTLQDQDQLIEFSDMDKDGFCLAKHPILPGHVYKLFAKCEGYPDVSAECKVPDLRTDFSITIDTITKLVQNNIEKYPEFHAIIGFKDISNQSNYYNILVDFSGIFNDNNYTLLHFQYRPINMENKIPSENNILFDDHLLDGKDIQNEYDILYLINYDLRFKTCELNVQVLETDVNYFKYHSSLSKYVGTDAPFTEYSPIYSNINGGYGIFASFISYKKTLKLK